MTSCGTSRVPLTGGVVLCGVCVVHVVVVAPVVVVVVVVVAAIKNVVLVNHRSRHGR